MIRWQTSGFRLSRHQRYTRRDALFPALEWATDELSKVDERYAAFFAAERVRAEQTVTALSRVDTGFMRSKVRSVQHPNQPGYELRFGWIDGVPHYARFQEFGIEPFGNHPGFEGMDAVGTAFREAVERLGRVL